MLKMKARIMCTAINPRIKQETSTPSRRRKRLIGERYSYTPFLLLVLNQVSLLRRSQTLNRTSKMREKPIKKIVTDDNSVRFGQSMNRQEKQLTGRDS